jgi:alpha-mannosidase
MKGELPNTDYTVAATCTPYETGINRVARDTLLSAEKFSSIATTISDYTYPYKTLSEAYRHSLLFAAHCWGHHGSGGLAHEASIAEKMVHAYKSAVLAEDVLTKSLNKIADQINLPEEGYHLIVFNSLSWERTDIVKAYFRDFPPCALTLRLLGELPTDWKKAVGGNIPIPIGSSIYGRDIVTLPVSIVEKNFDLIDESTGKKVPHQIIKVLNNDDPSTFAAYRHALSHKQPGLNLTIVFVAENIPPVGYKTYRITPRNKKSSYPSSIKVSNKSLENKYYKITVDPQTGFIESIYDKELEKEIVDQKASHGFNQHIARSPVDGSELSKGESNVAKGKEGSVLGSIIIHGKDEGCPKRVQEITIYDKIKRIDIANRILRDSTPYLEMYFSFPFSMQNPKFRFEATNSIVTPGKDQFPGSNTDYYAIQHWVKISNPNFGITFCSVDSHLVELGGLWPGYVSEAHHCITPPGYGHDFLKPGELKKPHIYSYVMNHNFGTNFLPTRIGDVVFRYSMFSHSSRLKELESRNFGWGVSTPLIPVFITGKQSGAHSYKEGFFSIEEQNVMILNIKLAEDKDGVIVRLLETEGKETVATLKTLISSISESYITNLVEEKEKPLEIDAGKIRIPIKPFGIVTVKLVLLKKTDKALQIS